MTVLPQLERELQAAHERQGTLHWRSALRPTRGLATALAATVALGIAAVGLVLVGHGAAGPRAASRSGPAQSVNAQIVANFAPFRRPRTSADALPPGITRGAFGCFGPAVPYPHIAPASVGLGSEYQLQCFTDQERDEPGVIFTGRRIIGGLQLDQARAVRLPGRLGTIWLIPSGRWLCNLLRSKTLLRFRGHSALVCEPINELLAHPPLWSGGLWGAPPNAPTDGAYLLGLEPDRVTKVTLGGYLGGTQRTYLGNNVLSACIGHGSAWLEQTGPTMNRAIKTLLGGGFLHGRPKRYRPATCPSLP